MKYQEIIESFVESGIPYDQFRDVVNIHKWYEDGWKFEIEDIPDGDYWEIDIIDFAEEEWGNLNYEQQNKLCDMWNKYYDKQYKEEFKQRLEEEIENE